MDCTASREAFEAHIREMLRPDIGELADDYTEADFICELGEGGWPDSCRWREIFCDLDDGIELTPRLREQALAYWEAGEEYPADDMRLDPCAAPDCPLRSLLKQKD